MLHTDTDKSTLTEISTAIQRLLECRHHEQFIMLCKHNYAGEELVRALIPGAGRFAVQTPRQA